MKQNMGLIDRVVRLIAGIVLGVLWYTGQVSDTAGIILLVIGVVMILTSAVAFCPAYLPFKLSTRKKD